MFKKTGNGFAIIGKTNYDVQDSNRKSLRLIAALKESKNLVRKISVMKSIQTRRANLFGALAMVFLLMATGVFGQEYRGTITGIVTDANGAVVPGANVTIQNVETNITSSTKTKDDGAYSFPLLLPGTYKVTATAENFKTTVRENIQVNIDARLSVDFQLEIGASAEVSVVADDEIIERGSVTTGSIITERQITELPLSEGAAYNLATQAPGVSYTGNPQFTGPTANGNLAAIRTNGAAGNQISLDGSPNLGFDGGVAYTPPADALAQFKIQTNAFDAQSGFTAGSTVNVAIKSGSNDFHGSVYYFNRPEQLTANNFFANRASVERAPRAYYRAGGQINGPLYFLNFGEGGPSIYNGKDRTFFMFSYEKQLDERAEPETFTVPTMAMRTGNFSELLGGQLTYVVPANQPNNCAGPPGTVVQLTNRDGSPQRAGQIYNPLSGLSVSRCNPLTGTVQTNIERLPFAGNIIPPGQLNQAALAFARLFPEPNQSGVVDNYFSNQSLSRPYDSYLTRIDHNFNASHRMYGKFSTAKVRKTVTTLSANRTRSHKGLNIARTKAEA